MSRYEGKIKVVCVDLMCFPVAPGNLEPAGVSCYDPYAKTCPDSTPVETISHAEWMRRRRKAQKRSAAHNGAGTP